MNAPAQLIDLAGLTLSGIWAEGHEPSLRTLYVWLQERKVPYHRLPGRRLVSVAEVVAHMRKSSWHWPSGVSRLYDLSTCPPNAMQLVRFTGLKEMGIWHQSRQPCDRTLRSMIARGQIPYYQVARTVFFRHEEVVHCLVNHSQVQAA